MKKVWCMAILAIFLFVGAAIADPETFTWTNPTTYIDGSAIPSAKLVQIKTHLFYGMAATGPWTEFAIVSGGAISYSGTPPPDRGVQAYYTLTSELDGEQSAYVVPSVAYMRPFIACNPPTGLIIK